MALTRDVNDALNKATALRERSKAASVGGAALFAQAREQAQRALALVENGLADAVLVAQVRQLQTELDEEEKDRTLVAALDAARLAQAETPPDKRRFARERAVPLFREAFRAYGLPAGEGEPTAAAERIRERPAAVREALLAALDEWDDLAGNPMSGITEPHREWLRAVLEAAEPEDGWGRQVRAARGRPTRRSDRRRSRRWPRRPMYGRLPARALSRLAAQLRPSASRGAVAAGPAAIPGGLLGQPRPGVDVANGDAARARRGGAFPDGRGRLAPESPGCRIDLGLALSDKGQLDEAIASYRKAIELDPKLAMAHTDLGNALLDKGQTDQAIASYRRAIELDPKDANAYGGLGACPV